MPKIDSIYDEVTVCGAPAGYDGRLIADWAGRHDGPILHIAKDDRRLAEIAGAISFFSPNLPIMSFPAWDCMPYDRISPRAEITSSRLSLLASIANGKIRSPIVILATINSATQYLPPRETISRNSLSASVGQRINRDEFVEFLSGSGYLRCSKVIEPGEFAVRGGIIDLFPLGWRKPARLDFFGDILDGIREFDPDSQLTTGKLKNLDIAPGSEFLFDNESVSRFRTRYRSEFGAPPLGAVLYESVSARKRIQGMEHWLPFFQERLETIFDYLPSATVSFDERDAFHRAERWDLVRARYETRAQSAANSSRSDVFAPPCRPELLYLNPEAFERLLNKRKVFRLRQGKLPPGPGIIDAGGRPGFKILASSNAKGQETQLERFANKIHELKRDFNVVVSCWTAGSRDRLSSLLEDSGVGEIRRIDSASDLVGLRSKACCVVWALESGFCAPGLAVISEQDVFGKRLVRTRHKKRAISEILADAAAFLPGDIVVHVEHGVAVYRGLETLKASNASHDCIVLEYEGGDRLYVPVENIDLLSRYGQDHARLDRLGAAHWQERKARMRKRILDMADDLLKVAAERALRSGHVIVPDRYAYKSFLARFQYEETDDQSSAIADVLSDLESGTPMDRLICGDVGFGKTEVAMRAAFVAALAGWQVGVVAPTTLLARQHYATFKERFSGFPIEIRQLSRLVGKSEAADIRKGIENGTIDIAIGTHALLADRIKFKNFGLLVIDEEQNFGVAQKEKLKRLRSQVHVLTLTATPIPRTIQMSMSGIKDMSVIGTPPADRLAIRTYVLEFDTVTVREALVREHSRRGQSFFVVPRISDLGGIAKFLEEQVPEVSFVVAHGRMSPNELQARTTSFFEGKAEVLLSTTIVAAGLDVPTANTVVVYRSDLYGLAQLYQIRGRVGRSYFRAYAYLTYNRRSKISEKADRRLRVLSNLDSLGAGFAVASHDLDIRGAGDILGSRQSGEIPEVGIELYQKMLEQTIGNLKAGGNIDAAMQEEAWSPRINLGVTVKIPDSYVADLDVRMNLYRRLSSLRTKVEIEGFAAEMIDRFGDMPAEVTTLLRLIRIKSLCAAAGVSRLDGGPKGATVEFRKGEFANTEGLISFIHDQKGRAKVRSNKLVVRRHWPGTGERMRGALAIAAELARIATRESRDNRAS
ncbi:MAG: transcription-repair coupling factor [Albidovulum sp.]|nr:transcription-repair coupling factor [Albidovulum sp.]